MASVFIILRLFLDVRVKGFNPVLTRVQERFKGEKRATAKKSLILVGGGGGGHCTEVVFVLLTQPSQV